MGRIELFRITIPNWNEFNPKHKKGYRATMIPNNFCTDARLNALPMSVRWLYLGLRLMCGEYANDTVLINERQVNDLLTSRLGCVNALTLLQEFQLLTFEKVPLIKENKREENKRNSRRGGEFKKTEIPVESAPPSQLALATPKEPAPVGVYVEAWQRRYGGRPPLRPQDTKALKTLAEENGIARLNALISAYLRMPDPWFVKKRHDLATFINNLTSIADFEASGRVVTRSDVAQLDSSLAAQNTLQALRDGGV